MSTNDSMQYKFPEGFYWGASTSSHQIEGGNVNNWSKWEERSAARLAKEAQGKFSHLQNWARIAEVASNPANYISGAACDHWHRFSEDFDIAKSLNHNAHRFSLEWSRIEPEEGRWDEAAIDHYRQVISALRERGIEPFVTIWHWTIPVWLDQKGGLTNPKFATYFARFAEKVASEFSGQVKFWITVNEPEVFVGAAYLLGEWPPEYRHLGVYVHNLPIYLWVTSQLIRAHKLAYRKIKAVHEQACVGIAKQNALYEAATDSFRDKFLVRLIRWWTNDFWLNQIVRHQDFVGVNYYFRNRLAGARKQNPNERLSDLGWELYPSGLEEVLVDVKKYGKPIYVTETGLADAQDQHREWYIKESVAATARAIARGADVRGYSHWSLLDNFEWDKGFWPRFGLVEVDFNTQERTVRASARIYAKIAAENVVEL